jgi:RimJ/RimL family protein N-acetyltransferase
MYSFLKRAAAKLNRHIGVSVRQTYLYRLSNADGWSAATACDESVKWELLLSRSRVGQLKDIGWFEPNDFVQRLRRGDRCYVASIDGRLAHYSWVQRTGSHPITEAGVSTPVGNGAFWIYHCVTADWARGRRIYPATLERIVSDGFAEGDSTAWIYTSTQNIPSQKGIERAGFRKVATLKALRVGSHYFYIGGHEQSQVVLEPLRRALFGRRHEPRPSLAVRATQRTQPSMPAASSMSASVGPDRQHVRPNGTIPRQSQTAAITD